MGESRNPSDPASYGLDPKTATLRLKFRVQKTNYSAAGTTTSANPPAGAGTTTTSDNNELPGWEAVLWRGRLYVSVTPQTLSNGSKEAFVSLLEYAEDVLECSHVIVCLGKPSYLLQQANNSSASSGIDTNDKDIKMAIRNFMFLGFQALAPGHEFMPSNPNLVCFYYTI